VSFSLLGGSSGPLDKVLMRATAVDSCGLRYYATSGKGFSSPVNGSADLATKGVQTCRFNNADPPVLVCVDLVSSPHVLWGNRWAHAIRTFDDQEGHAKLYVAAPGYGVMARDIDAVPVEDPCETTRPARLVPSTEETLGPLIGRRVFTLAEAKGMVLFDLSGRRTEVRRPGIYFDQVVKDKRVVGRKTVLVTP
jgi:hypothetical protein